MVNALISVVIPCYLCSDTIERAVESVWLQTWRPYEIILVEDFSPDKDATGNMLKQLKQKYPDGWIKLIFLPKNRGPGNARNVGWHEATQKYVAFLDADDAWHPLKIEIQLGFMMKNEDACLAGHRYRIVKKSGIDEHCQIDAVKTGDIIRITGKKVLMSNMLATSSVMLKKDIPYRFDNTKYYSEDYLLWLEIILNGGAAFLLCRPLYYIFPHGQKQNKGLSTRLKKMEKGEIETYRALYHKGLISFYVMIFLIILSYIKYTKRLFMRIISFLI